MQKENKKEIRSKILNKYNLKNGDKINYELFGLIYQEFKNIYDEKTFAEEILQISYGSYCQIKYNQEKKATILKDEKIDVNLIRDEILNKYALKPGDKINYQKITKIVEEYGNIIDEKTIVYDILGISKQMFYPIKKNPNYSTTILPEVYKQNLNELRNKIFINEKEILGKFINYEQLKNLAQKYEINDRDLATEIFGIKGFNYDNIKFNSNRRTKILRDSYDDAKKEDIHENKDEDKKIEIKRLRNKIIVNEKLIPGSRVNYDQIHNIYLKYENIMSENDFAVNILGINNTRLSNIKSNKKDRAIILKDMLDLRIEQVRKDIIEKDKIKPGESINYEKLNEIIKKWNKYIEELVLVRDVLGLSAEIVRTMKRKPNQKSLIMKDFIVEKTDEQIQFIRDEIFKKHNIKPGDKIDYNFLKTIHLNYINDLDEKNFAIKVLSIPQDKYLLIRRNSKKKTKVCKELEKQIDKKEYEKIRQSVYNEFDIKEGKKINYEELCTIHFKWKNIIKERDFAEKVLGISDKSYYGIKYDEKKKAYILNPNIKEKADKIKYIIEREKRFYTLDEINKICKENQITVDEFCSYVVQRTMHKRIYLEENFYKELLNKKGKVFIGRGEKISNKFAKKNQDLIIGFSKSLAIEECKTYQSYNSVEDYAQDTMIYIIENCGDLEKNFEDDFPLCKGLIYTRAKAFVKGKIIADKKVKTVSIDSYYTDRKDNSLLIKSQNKDISNEVINAHESIEEKDILIGKVLASIEEGIDPIESIRSIANANKIDPDVLVNKIKLFYKKTKIEKDEERI